MALILPPLFLKLVRYQVYSGSDEENIRSDGEYAVDAYSNSSGHLTSYEHFLKCTVHYLKREALYCGPVLPLFFPRRCQNKTADGAVGSRDPSVCITSFPFPIQRGDRGKGQRVGVHPPPPFTPPPCTHPATLTIPFPFLPCRPPFERHNALPNTFNLQFQWQGTIAASSRLDHPGGVAGGCLEGI